MLYCKSCNQELNEDLFYKDKKRSTGYRCYCKSCEKKRNNSYEPNLHHRQKILDNLNGEKVCIQCKCVKSLDMFAKNKSNLDGYRSWCRSCCKEYRDRNIEQYRQKGREYYQINKEKIQNQNKIAYEEFKSGMKCIKCGESEAWCLDFHHIKNRNGNDTVGKLRKCANGKAKEEIKKCVVFCSNCHRKFHFRYGNRNNNQKQIDDFLELK